MFQGQFTTNNGRRILQTEGRHRHIQHRNFNSAEQKVKIGRNI